MKVPSEYEVLESPLLARMSSLPVRTAVDLLTAADPLEATRGFYRDSAFAREAVAVASPSLASAINAWIDGSLDDERVALRALSYALRMSSRCTPFGLFAGVASLPAADTTTLAVEPAAFRTQTRPDMGAIGALVADIESSDARKRLRYVRNSCSFVRGGRLYVVNVDLANFGEEGIGSEQRDVSLRYTPAVAFVCEQSAEPREYSRLAHALSERFGASGAESERLLDRLSSAGVIVSELRVSPLGDPLGRLLERLERAVPERARELREAFDALQRLDDTPVPEQTRAQREEITISTQTDLRVAFSGALGAHVLREVATLADLSIRSGEPLTMQCYRDRFIDRYEGTTRLVPLLELTHNDLGLGAPESLSRDEPEEHQAAIRHLLSEATRDGIPSIDLRDGLFDRFFPPSERGRVGALEVGFHIAARSRDAIDRGDFLLIHASIFDRAARSAARFAAMLGGDFASQLRDAVRRSIAPDELVAEFTYAPISSRHYNVLVRPHFYDLEVTARVFPAEPHRAISPDDLFVGLSEDGFYLWSRSLERRVSLRETHALMTSAGPNLCRFIALLFGEGMRRPEFSLGASEQAPYHPRLTYGRIVLRERGWSILREELETEKAAHHALRRRRERWNMPRYVYLCEGDNQLLLDLDSAVAPKLLRLHASERDVRIKEALPSPEEMWLSGPSGEYNAEFVAQAIPRTLQPARATGARPLDRRSRFGAGSRWIYLKLYLPEQAGDDLLVSEIGPIIDRLRSERAIDRWHFVRYADPRHHLRLRVRVADEADASLARNHVLDVMERLLQAEGVLRYTLETYEPEYERYGGVEGMDRAEAFFTVDSDACLNALAARLPNTDAAIEAAVITFDAFVRCDKRLDDSLLQIELRHHRALSTHDREMLRRLRRAAREPAAALLAALGDECTSERLGTFIHMHCNRFGLKPEAEARVAVLLRGLALSRRAATREPRAPASAGPPRDRS